MERNSAELLQLKECVALHYGVKLECCQPDFGPMKFAAELVKKYYAVESVLNVGENMAAVGVLQGFVMWAQTRRRSQPVDHKPEDCTVVQRCRPRPAS